MLWQQEPQRIFAPEWPNGFLPHVILWGFVGVMLAKKPSTQGFYFPPLLAATTNPPYFNISAIADDITASPVFPTFCAPMENRQLSLSLQGVGLTNYATDMSKGRLRTFLYGWEGGGGWPWPNKGSWLNPALDYLQTSPSPPPLPQAHVSVLDWLPTSLPCPEPGTNGFQPSDWLPAQFQPST